MFGNCPGARKRLQQRTMRTLGCYVVVLFCTAYLVRKEAMHGWALYFYSVLPAIPIIMMIVGVGRYLQEESDEFQRTMMIRSILVGTAALLGTLAVNDFVRAFTGADAFAPFVSFAFFGVGMGTTQLIQTLTYRVGNHDEPLT